MTINMNRIIKWSLATLVLFFSVTACEDPDTFFDPINPDLSEDAVVGTVNSAQRLLEGTERQLALLMQEWTHIVEIASDNYVNTATFFNQFLDDLAIDATDADINDFQFDLARMRELAVSGLNVIGPGDPNFDENQSAEFSFFIGLSYLIAGEHFTALPAEPGGELRPAADHLQLAVTNFNEGLQKVTDDFTRASLLLGLARAQYFLGNQAEAVSAANEVIALDPDFVRFAEFDGINGPANTMQDALWDRGTFDDLQPLPRLDFLDPKYNGSIAGVESNTPLLKIEEAHLILAEAAIADNNLGAAQGIMKDIIGLVGTRETKTFNDAVEGRTQNAPGSRPDTSAVEVRASAGDPFRSGLVISRQAGPVTVPAISGTSVTEAMVDALTNADDALEMLYLMRQEIFIAEGRRTTDLGIRFVVSEVEFLSNPNVQEADKTPVFPPFIESIKTELDDFTYDMAAFQCTITHNLNAIIVANKASDFVAPFH